MGGSSETCLGWCDVEVPELDWVVGWVNGVMIRICIQENCADAVIITRRNSCIPEVSELSETNGNGLEVIGIMTGA